MNLPKVTHALMLGTAWGLSVIMMKFAANSGMEILQIIFLSSLGVAAVLYTYLKILRRRISFDSRFLLFGLVCGLLAYLIPEYLSIAALRHISAGLLSIVLTTVPVFTYLIALITRGDHFHVRKVAGLVLGFGAVSILLITRNGLSLEQINIWLLICILIALCYALYDVFASRYWPENHDTIEVAFDESIFVVLLIAPYLMFVDYSQSLAALSKHYWIILVLILLWSGERIIYFTAIKHGGAVYAAQTSYIAPPISIILGMVIFNEPFEITLWVCFVIILIAVMLISSVPRQAGDGHSKYDTTRA